MNQPGVLGERPQADLEKHVGEMFQLGYVDEQYFNVKIQYTQEDENKALDIMPCYVTQFTADEIKEDREKKTSDTGNVIHFRRFVTAKGMRTSF